MRMVSRVLPWVKPNRQKEIMCLFFSSTDLPSVFHLERLRRRSQIPNCPEIDRGGFKVDLWRCFLLLHVQDQSMKSLHSLLVFGEIQDIALG